MTQHQANPYRTVPDGSVAASDWNHLTGAGFSVLPAVLADWDALTLLQIGRRLAFPRDLRSSCSLPDDAALSLVVTWHATGSGLRDVCFDIDIPPDAPFECDIQAEIPGCDLGGQLTLSTRIVLAREIHQLGPGSAHLAGSRIWEDTWTVRLEGDEPAFPITMLDFGDTLFDSNAEWHLEISDDAADAAMGAIRLYLNSRFPTVAGAFANAGSPDSAQRAILNSVKADVQRLQILRALLLDDTVVWDEGSLGSLLMHRVETVFPGSHHHGLRDLAHDHPDEFETQLRGRIGPVFEPRS